MLYCIIKIGYQQNKLDDMNNFIPIFDGYEVDKDNPGVVWHIE